MRWGPSDRTLKQVLRAAFVALLLIGSFSTGYAQEPPLSVPKNMLPVRPGDALALDGWLFYPTVRTYTQYSDNVFQTVFNPISAWSWGITPGLIAEWSNGIHTTTLYGNLNLLRYPTETEINVFDRKAGVVQKYEALRDLIFRVQGDYTHQTYASVVTAIPGAIAAPGAITLPNGNIQMPNGDIISPITGLVVGHVSPSLNVLGTGTLINPSDQFTGIASIEKILNRGFIGLTGSLSRTEYQNTLLASDYTAKTLTGRGSVWLSPVFYAYTDATFNSTTYATASATTAYRAVGGIGTRQFGLFRASGYYGHQGSEVQDSGTAGGEVYGGRLTYYPTPISTIGIGVDETVNISHQTAVTNVALNNQTPSALVIPIGVSTRITGTSLNTSYLISRQWSAYGSFGYTRAQYIDSPRVDNAWLADVVFQYQMWRNMTLSWEYQYSSIVSNVPLSSSQRNFVSMGATYKF